MAEKASDDVLSGKVLEALAKETSNSDSLRALVSQTSKYLDFVFGDSSFPILELLSAVLNKEFIKKIKTLSKEFPDKRFGHVQPSIIRLLLWYLRRSLTSFLRGTCNNIDISTFGNIPFKQTNQDGEAYAPAISIEQHTRFFQIIGDFIRTSEPSHIYFPGEESCYVQLSGISLENIDNFTLNIWANFDTNCHQKFEMCRCRSQHGGIDIIFSNMESSNKWTVTIRTNNKFEKQFQVKVAPNIWNLFTISHCKNQKSMLQFSLNGTSIFSTDQLMYPFTSAQSADWKWMFGVGFLGMIASASLYNNIIDKTILKLLFEQGPNCCNLHQSYRCPFYSSESSFVTQGTILARGYWAKKALKLSLVLSLSVELFNESSSSVLSTPQKFPGNLSETFNELGLISQDTERDASAFFAGNCKVNNNFHIQKNFPELGGSCVWLYFLWLYCSLLKDSHNEDSAPKIIELVYTALQTMLHLLQSSGEFREDFLQNHGFHVIGYSLSLIKCKDRIDENIVRSCVDIVYCFGIDSRNFDAIASSFQGLLFCFKVWGSCTSPVKKIIFDSICIFANEKDKILHKSMGCRNILDILKWHIFSHPDQREDYSYVCVAACKVVRFALDHAKATALDPKPAENDSNALNRFGNIITYLLSCIEESNNEFFCEELLIYLYSLKTSMPKMLFERLKDRRYWDTTFCLIVSRQGSSKKTKQLATELLIWSVSKNYSDQVVLLHDLWHLLRQESISYGVGGGDPKIGNKTPLKSKSGEARRFYDISQKYLTASAQLSKAWELMSFLGSYIQKLTSSWQDDPLNVNHDCFIDGLNLESISVDLFAGTDDDASNAGTGRDSEQEPSPKVAAEVETTKIWFYLPFLENLLSNCSFDHLQKCITTLNMALKADPVAMEIIISFPFNQYMNVLVNMAVTNYSDSDSNANVSTDLILDMIVYTTDSKIKTRPDDCFNILTRLESIVLSNSLISEYEANLFLIKYVTLYLHYIVKSYESNSEISMKLLRHLLIFGNSKGYCGSLVVLCGSTSINSDDLYVGTSSKLSPHEQKQSFNSSTTSIESILCTCILEILRNYKKFSKAGVVIPTLDYYTILLSWLTIIPRINELSDSILDFITMELFSTIQFFIDIKNKSFLNEVQVVLFFQLLFTLLKKARSNCTTDRREKYVALGLAMCNRVFELKNYLTSTEHHVSEFIGKFDLINLDIAIMSEFIDSKFNVDIKYTDFMDQSFLVDKNYESEDATIFESFLQSSSQSSTLLAAARPPSPQGLSVKGGVTSYSISSSTSLLSSSSSISAGSDLGEPRGQLLSIDKNFGIVELEFAESAGDLSAEDGSQSATPKTLDEWWNVRKGILADRIDCERSRMAKFEISNDLSFVALDKFLQKKANKIEQEIFEDKADCHWKLSVSNEGHFPGRKRFVLRPHKKYKMNQYRHYSSGNGESPSKSGESSPMQLQNQHELGEALAKTSAVSNPSKEGVAIIGEDFDVNEGGGIDGKDEDDDLLNKALPVAKIATGGSTSEASPKANYGESWGIVDSDGTENGYGVVGIALDSSFGSNGGSGVLDGSSASDQVHYNDMLGDLQRAKLSYADEYYADCGPSLPGSQKIFTKEILSSPVFMITASGSIWGTIGFNEKEIYFVASLEPEGGQKTDHVSVAVDKGVRMRRRKWQMIFISAIYLRRYRLRDTAIEVFFKKGKHRSFFIDFGHTKENEKTREYFARQLMNYAPTVAAKQWPTTYGHYFSFVYSSGIQDKWLNGELSNFDYLMMVNTLAGRSFNDLCQYPVMPWVLQQYTEPFINLSDPNSYRDLSKPMGALNKDRLEEFTSRYRGFADNVSSEIPAFMYGSHYSTMVGVVLYFLVRLQPYAALHQEMQNGNFDVADRLFASIPRTFFHNTTQLSEVKEITPEWFTCPDMFRNVNNFDFGKTQDGEVVGDVELPPWARTPEEFVRINREALESDFVSEHLHEWIDLIFGYKQHGPAAVDANNVFFYLTYYGMVDRDKLDETLRLATELQIAHFGQMPVQIFNKPHPPKKPRGSFRVPRCIWKFNMPLHSIPPILKMPNSIEEQLSNEAGTMIFTKTNLSRNLIVASTVTANRIILFHLNGTIESYKFGLSEYAKSLLASFTFRRKRRSVVSTPSTSVDTNDGDSEQASTLDDDNRSQSSSNDGKREERDSADESDETSIIKFSATESLLFMERDSSQQDVPPRVPMCLVNGFNSVFNRTFTSCFSNNIVISGGFHSGRISVRELDSYTGSNIESAGDFFGHLSRVVSIASDRAPSATSVLLKDAATSHEASYEMVCSIDESGVMLLWTINQVHTQDKVLYLISRRPFRMYNLWPADILSCDICCNLNIIVALVGSKVYLFSIEREEKISEFEIDNEVSENAPSLAANVSTAANLIGSKIAVCDDGYLAVHLVPASSKHASDGHLRVFTLTGRECARIDGVQITFMCCPPQSNLLVCGFTGGFVNIYNFSNLKVLCSLNPHHDCVSISSSSKGNNKEKEASLRRESITGSIGSSAKSSNPSLKDSIPLSASVPNSSIKWVTLAPEPTYSAMITIVNERGEMFIKALPDFISWNSTRSPNVFVTQLISVPLQNVKDTTQHLIITTTENAAVAFQNAKSFADNAISELKKNTFGVLSSLWGGGSSSSSSSSSNSSGGGKDRDK